MSGPPVPPGGIERVSVQCGVSKWVYRVGRGSTVVNGVADGDWVLDLDENRGRLIYQSVLSRNCFSCCVGVTPRNLCLSAREEAG